MAGNTDIAEQGKNMLAHAVVDYPFAADRALFLGIESGCVIFEILDESAGLWSFVKNLGLAFIDLATTGHSGFLTQEETTIITPRLCESKSIRNILSNDGSI